MPFRGYFLGCPIWSNKDWVGELFAKDAKQKDYLRQYASVFNTVEGNTTFYGLPTKETAMRWVDETPEGFRFALKFPRAISHDKRLRDAAAETDAFLRVLAILDDHAGASFLQLPPSFGPADLPVLDAYLGSLPRDFACAVEVRHRLFFAEAEGELNAMLTAHGADRVVFDTRGVHADGTDDPAGQAARRKKPKVPVRFTATGPRPFMRFVGYPDVDENIPLLAEWAPVVARWMREGRTPFIFMHAPNDYYAPRLARHFHRLLSEHIDAGDMPVWPAERTAEQMRLF